MFLLFLENKELKTFGAASKDSIKDFLNKNHDFCGYWTPHNPLKHAHLLKIEK
jgi:hypothetical protein